MSTEDKMSIEDRVRTATRARASLVRGIRPLPAPEPARLRHRRAPASHRWLTWGVPLTAAAAVVAIALSLAAVRQHGTPSPATSQSATVAPTTIPRYYVALTNSIAPSGHVTGGLIVGDDLTGKAIATVGPPDGLFFVGVTGAADDRSFLVTAEPDHSEANGVLTWYLLRIAPGTGAPYRLTKLPVNAPLGFPSALSPDGRELAVESLQNNPTKLTIYSVASGAVLHTWTGLTTIGSGLLQPTLSWSPDGQHLVFSVFQAGPPFAVQLRTLDVTAPGTDLMSGSRSLITVQSPAIQTCFGMHLTPDGATAICDQYAGLSGTGKSVGCPPHAPDLVAYSVRTGKPARVLYQYPGTCTSGFAYLLWTDASASHVIIATEIAQTRSGQPQTGQLQLITEGGGSTPIKLPKSVLQSDYPAIAF